MALTYWTFPILEAAPFLLFTAFQHHCFCFILYIVLTCVDVCVFSVVFFVCVAGLVTQRSLPLSRRLSLELHPAKVMAALLVKRFVYPIRMMKRPFISTLPLARRWQELYLDKPLKHAARHETAPSEDVRRRYTYSLTNTQYFLHKTLSRERERERRRKKDDC